MRPDLTRNYHILRPVPTHFRVATCKDVNCDAYTNGWRTRLPATAHEMLTLARRSGRKFVELDTGDGYIEFLFEAGQPCFRASMHRAPLERPAIHVVRDGVSSPRKVSMQNWHDDLGEHLDRIRSLQERG